MSVIFSTCFDPHPKMAEKVSLVLITFYSLRFLLTLKRDLNKTAENRIDAIGGKKAVKTFPFGEIKICLCLDAHNRQFSFITHWKKKLWMFLQ